MPRNRLAPTAILAIIIGSMVAILALGDGPPPPPFRVGLQSWVGYAPGYLARAEEPWNQQGIAVVELLSDAELVRAMRAEILESACMTLDGAFRVQSAGIDIRILSVLDYSEGADAVVAVGPNPVTELTSLRRRRIAVERHGVGMLFFARALQRAGLNLREVTIVNADLTEHEQLLVDGKIDAVVTYSPHKERFLQRGGRVLADSSLNPEQIVDVLVVRADAVHNHPEMVRELLRGWNRSRERLDQDANLHPVVARMMGMTLQEFVSSRRQLRIPNPLEDQTLISPTQPSLFPSAVEIASSLNSLDLLEGAIDPTRLFLTHAEWDLMK